MRPPLAAASTLRAAAMSALAAAALVALAYQWPATLEVDFGRALTGGLTSDGLYESEGAYRWSRGSAEILFPDPGARSRVMVNVLLSGFRPRGSPLPRLVLRSGDDVLRETASARLASYDLVTETAGVWSSTLRVQIRSETFTPGRGDERVLGVRLHRARLVLGGPAIPPLKQTLASGFLGFLFFVSLGVSGLSGRARLAAALGFAAVLGTGFAFYRLEAAFLVPTAAVVLTAIAAAARTLPGAAAFALDTLREAGRSLSDGALTLSSPFLFGLLLFTGGLVFAAYAFQPKLAIALGTGEAEPIARRFGAFHRDFDRTFRRPLPGARLDLRDFGGGSPWKVGIEAAVDETPLGIEPGILARTEGKSLAVELAPEWKRYSFDLEAPPWSFRSGHVLEFPGFPEGRQIRISKVEIDRGRSLPSFRALSLALAIELLLVGGAGASGLQRRTSLLAGTVSCTLVLVGVALAPVVFLPLLGRIALGAATALGAIAMARGVVSSLAARELAPRLPAAALAAAALGFSLWFLSTASPLYSGGHFGYHTAIAEEISRGKFFLYYFPGPENMLSRQPQWGNLTVPHPNLFHTMAAPLALLPGDGFHLGTKLLLALLLFGSTVIVALTAAASGDSRSSSYAAMAMVGLPTAPQLLGLGHLMTILGVAAAAAALGFIAVHAEELGRRRVFLLALVLLSLAFVSYTGTLLFGSASLAAGTLLLRREPEGLSRRLGTLLLAAWGAALLLYYLYWVPAFVTETAPRLLEGSGPGGSANLGSRLGLLPAKLDYTFGSWTLPILGLAGLSLARGTARRTLLGCWGMVLVVFSAFDLAFNFLLKHHYFSLPAVAIGLGLAFRWLDEKKPWGRVILIGFVVFLWWTGLREMLRVATGNL